MDPRWVVVVVDVGCELVDGMVDIVGILVVDDGEGARDFPKFPSGDWPVTQRT